MKQIKRTVILHLLSLAAFTLPAQAQTTEPRPFGPVPTANQIEWQKLEYYMFVHFGPNTFTDVEWGDGSEDPRVFNPTDLDCRQWAATAKAAGMRGIILTVKHHDGFCLWPSRFSSHTVRESAWKEGKGDVVRELSEACREYGLRMGVYLSPWDRNHPAYGTPEYNRVFAGMLDEVLTGYGDIFEQWFDGANGEGPNGKRQVYDWALFNGVVRDRQPGAVIFSDVGPDVRWVGNERGVAGETNWSTLNVEGFEPGHGAPPSSVLNTGVQGGEAWVPAEVDVSIRPGWFYSPSTDGRVKSAAQLMNIYYTSVGRGSNLLLNVPPDARGRIHPRDSVALMEFRRAREEAFAENLAAGATAVVLGGRGEASRYAASNLTDDDYETFWAADGALSPSVEIDLGEERTFDRLLIQEYIPLGQRVTAFAVDYWNQQTGVWTPLTRGTTVGYKRIVRFEEVATPKIRIAFSALAGPVISTVALYGSPR